jgi:hypothetical protein
MDWPCSDIDVLVCRVEDHMALETGNRALTRWIDAREAESAHAPHDRVASIEQRLGAIERRSE